MLLQLFDYTVHVKMSVNVKVKFPKHYYHSHIVHSLISVDMVKCAVDVTGPPLVLITEKEGKKETFMTWGVCPGKRARAERLPHDVLTWGGLNT